MSAPAMQAVVIGGGYAGISAALTLADAGASVTLLEARRHWGGRATSWPDPKLGDPIDNGQHVWMGCYHATGALLARLGTADRITFAPSIELVLREPGGRETRLSTSRLPGRWGRLWGLATWSALPFGERIALARALAQAPAPAADLTASAWLDALGQGPAARRFFWRPLVEAALNQSEDRAPASLLYAVVERAFRADARAAAVGLPRVGLAELLEPIERALAERGGEARRGASVRTIEPPRQSSESWTIALEDGTLLEAGQVVVAVPADEARALLVPACPELGSRLERAAALESSPIVTATLWFDTPVLTAPMIGLIAPPAGIGPGFQWAFDRSRALGVSSGRYAVTLVASAARELAPRPTSEILERAHAALELYGLTSRRAVFGRVVKEPNATPSFTPATLAARPPAASGRPGLALAGDWTDTGLPATIEGAVLSGRAAARALLHI